MRVIIAGSRHMPFSLYPLIQKAVDASGFDVTEVVSGMALGADTYGMKWAYSKEPLIPIAKFPAEWDKYGKGAGPIRNAQMAEYADALIVFIWDGSRGSQNMLDTMTQLNKPTYIVYNGELA